MQWVESIGQWEGVVSYRHNIDEARRIVQKLLVHV